jgi:hypothetical protein
MKTAPLRVRAEALLASLLALALVASPRPALGQEPPLAPAPEPGADDGPEQTPPETPAGPETPAAPGAAIDLDAYARQLHEQAIAARERGEGGKVVSWCDYLTGPLGQARYVRERAKEIAALRAAGQDLLAEAVLKRAEELAPKNPAKAKEKLAELRALHGGTAFVARERERVERLETEVRTALWSGKSAWRGAAVLPADGVLRLTYELARVEELADLAFAKSPPRLEGGRLAPAKADGVLRHRLPIPAGATFTADLQLRGLGRVALLLEGEEPEAALASKASVIELESSASALEASIGRADEKDRPRASLARPSKADAATAWRARIERRAGVVSVSLSAGAEADAPAARVERAPGADEVLSAPHGRAFRLGLAALSGKVEVERLAVEGPLPAEGPEVAAGAAAPPALPPLPKRVWIPLAKKGKEGWKEQGAWVFEGETIRQGGGPASLVSKELEGRALGQYTLTVDVRMDKEDGRRPRQQQPLFALVLPVGEAEVAWVFTGREMRLDGAADARMLGLLPPDQWQTLVVKVDAKQVECYVGAKRVLASPRDKVDGTRLAQRANGFAIRTFPGLDRVELRAPKIRLE